MTSSSGSFARCPRVESVGMTFSLPMGYIFDGCAAAPEGQVAAADEPEFNLGCNPVTPELLRHCCGSRS